MNAEMTVKLKICLYSLRKTVWHLPPRQASFWCVLKNSCGKTAILAEIFTFGSGSSTRPPPLTNIRQSWSMTNFPTLPERKVRLTKKTALVSSPVYSNCSENLIYYAVARDLFIFCVTLTNCSQPNLNLWRTCVSTHLNNADPTLTKQLYSACLGSIQKTHWIILVSIGWLRRIDWPEHARHK